MNNFEKALSVLQESYLTESEFKETLSEGLLAFFALFYKLITKFNPKYTANNGIEIQVDPSASESTVEEIKKLAREYQFKLQPTNDGTVISKEDSSITMSQDGNKIIFQFT